jgi:hypothetical protein
VGFFGKLFGGGGGAPKPPRWGKSFETLDRYNIWLEWLQDDLERRGIPQLSKTLRMGAMTVKLEKKNVTVSFFKLVEACAITEDQTVWTRELDDLLNARIGKPRLIEDPGPMEDPFAQMPPERPVPTAAEGDGPAWTKARGLIKTQFFSEEYVEGLNLARDAMITGDFAPGLVAVLMYDHGGFEQTVPRTHAEAWGKSDHELLGYGFLHVRETETVETQNVEGMPGVFGNLVMGNGYFVSAWAATIEPPEGETWPDGILISFPSRHGAMYHVIDSAQVVGALGWMSGITDKLSKEYADPISSRVYWRRGETWTLMPYTIQQLEGEDTPRIELNPPRDFAEILQKYAPDQMSGDVEAPTSETPAE